MNKIFLNLMLLAALPLGVQRAGAAGPDTNSVKRLTLEHAIQLAEQSSPALAEARAQLEAATGRAGQAGAFPNPDAILRVESASVRGDSAGDAEYVGGISQTVPLGSRLGKARQAGQFERERMAGQLESTRREVRQRVHGAFATALYQDQAFQLQSRAGDHLARAVALMRARVTAGDALPDDLARVEMELARTRVELKRAELLRQQAVTTLIAAIGNPALAIESLAGNLDATFDLPTIESLAADLSTHPAAAAAAANVRAQAVRVSLAKAERIPDVKVDLLYRRLEAERRDSFDVGVSIPLPLFDRNQGRVREARAELRAAEARSRATQNELTQRLYESHAALTAALANQRALKEEILPRAETILQASEARHAAGDINLNEALSVRRDWAAVQLTHLESLRAVMEAWIALSPFVNERKGAP